MKAAVARKPVIKIAVVESDPLRFVGFRALFDAEPEFELVSASLPEISTLQGIDLILLGNRNGQNLFDVMASLKATRPDLRSGHASRVCASDPDCEPGIGVGSAQSAFDVH
jgi:hypothetical protein